VQFKVADMKVAVENARLAVRRAAWLRDAGRPFKAEAAMAKLSASEAAVDAAREAVQIHGGYGFMEESPSRASTATRRSWRSARARARSSAS
jgi:alkylation response protein AidB-like acyl-CoA dehydrogenase